MSALDNCELYSVHIVFTYRKVNFTNSKILIIRYEKKVKSKKHTFLITFILGALCGRVGSEKQSRHSMCREAVTPALE